MLYFMNHGMGNPQMFYSMIRDVRGTWVLTASGDHKNSYYTYRVKVGDQYNEAADPYAKVVGVNGDTEGSCA